MSFSWGHWYFCFRRLVISALGFKARVDPCVLSCLCDGHIHLFDPHTSVIFVLSRSYTFD